jgi:purine-binding chemotaxis protein CheW
MRLIGRIANFDAQSRMILLVDPAQILDQVEADMLKKFDRSSPQRRRRRHDQLLIADDSR